jgi:hypothetical protein
MAAGDVLQVAGTPIVWDDAGTDKQLQLGNLAAGSALGGAYLDRGTGPIHYMYLCTLRIVGLASAPGGEGELAAKLHWCGSHNATEWDGEVGTPPTETVDTVTGPSAGEIGNLREGNVQVRSVDNVAGTVLQKSGLYTFGPERYVFPVVSAVLQFANVTTHKLTIVPVNLRSLQS